MSYTKEMLENDRVKFTVDVDTEQWKAALNEAYIKERSKYQVDGFRKGHAPRAFIERIYGPQVFFDEALDIVLPKTYDEILDKETELFPVDRPEVSITAITDSTLQYTAEVQLKPTVTLGAYTGLEFTRDKVKVTKEEVSEEIERARENAGWWEQITDRPAQMGDKVKIDYTGSVDGAAFEGGTAADYELTLGSGAFIPGFEEGVVGMNVGESKNVNVKFPEQYHAENLAGKDAVFVVTVKDITVKKLPELDDEFAKDVSEFDTLEEYKADLRKNLAESRKTEAERSFKSEIMNQALDNMTAEVPESMIAEKTNEFLDNYADSMGLRGRVSREELIKGMGMGEEEFNSMMRPGALRQVQADLLLDAVVKAEGLEATEEEKADFYKKLEEDYGENAEQIKAMIDEKLMARDIERRKAADLIYSSAVRTAPKAEEAPVEENKD